MDNTYKTELNVQVTIEVWEPGWHYFCLIIERMDVLGLIPITGLDVKIIFISIPERPTYKDAKSFRPIDLTFFLLK